MFDIYTKPFRHSFGTGEEWIVVDESGVIRAHGESYGNPCVFPTVPFDGYLVNKSVNKRGKGWRKIRKGFELENAQPWAQDMIDLAEGRL
jgi:hypothetical protein